MSAGLFHTTFDYIDLEMHNLESRLISLNCRWVYYEMGTMCHVKAVEGTRRDNVTDLIKVIICSYISSGKNHLLTSQ